MKAFNPYAKGIPEKKEFKPRYESLRATSSANDSRSAERKPVETRQNLSNPNAANPSASNPNVSNPNVSNPIANAHGQFSKREYTPPVDKDLLDGLENNLRRQRGWADDEKPNEVVDGISIISISKADLKKKLAAQKQGGFAGGNT